MKRIAESTVRRLSLYLRFLEEFEKAGKLTISSGELAKSGGTTSAQVRKDLSFFGSFGKRGLGYSIRELIGAIRGILGLRHSWKVVIVGAGKIGAALAQYSGFPDRGFNVVGIFDNDAQRVGQWYDGVRVADVCALEADVRRLGAEIAIIAVPPGAAQGVADRVAAAGIHAILDFSTAAIVVPPSVTLRSMNMAVELEILSFALTEGARS
ncbi:MAG: redox-sensing transcriptional repressor Rex [Gemmatimonadaceae bacterium]